MKKIKSFKQFRRYKKPQQVTKVLENVVYEVNGDLDKAIKLLSELKKKHVGEYSLNLEIDTYDDFGDTEVYVRIVGSRKETAVEFEDRIEKEYASYKQVNENEIKHLESLKAKWEG
jgi:hypothetical protein